MKKLIFVVSLCASAALAELQPEPTGTIETLPETWPAHWIIAHDAAFFHMSDGKLIVLDADSDDTTQRFKGFMNAAFIGVFVQARTRPEIYLAETFRSRGTRGERTDVLTIYDKRTLGPIGEVVLPPKRSSNMPTDYNVALVLCDEVYDQIVYDDNQHVSIASLPGMWERTFSCYAYTKVYAMDGWRLGYVTCHEKFMPALMMIAVNDVAHVNVFIQEGAYAALTGPQDCRIEMLAEDDRRRQLVSRRLNAIDGISCPLPQGTIYSFPDVSAFGIPSLQMAEEILAETRVVTEDGSFYGATGEGHLRICFGAESYERIDEAMDRLQQYFESQKTRRIAS